MRRVLLVAAALALFAGVLWKTALDEAAVACEACVAFGGRTQCGTVRAATREDAAARALSHACSIATTGVTDTLACERQPPLSLTCRAH